MGALMAYVTVIGTGTMATGIAADFLGASVPVVVLGRTQKKAQQCLSDAIALCSPEKRSVAGSSRAGEIDTWKEWADCRWIVETIVEDLPTKQALFRFLDKRVPEEIPIGSNSSAYPISKIAQGLKTAHRMMGAHYFMPAELVPLVEIVLGEKTDPTIADTVYAFYQSIEKKPVLVKKDIPGFLANRIQHALMREALYLIDRGIATPDDVDDAVRYSFGFRYAAVGPITQKELSGWDVNCNAAKEIYPALCNDATMPASILNMVKSGKTGTKSLTGFWSWTPEKVKALKEVYSKRLQAAFTVLKMDK
jgi:3-hydroxybutyryl-CoA dehydrogenase